MTTNKQIEKELEFLTTNELLEIKKLIVSLYDKEVKQEELTKSFNRKNDR